MKSTFLQSTSNSLPRSFASSRNDFHTGTFLTLSKLPQNMSDLRARVSAIFKFFGESKKPKLLVLIAVIKTTSFSVPWKQSYPLMSTCGKPFVSLKKNIFFFTVCCREFSGVLLNLNYVNLPNFIFQQISRVGQSRNDAIREFRWINMWCAHGQYIFNHSDLLDILVKTEYCVWLQRKVAIQFLGYY